MFKKFLYAFVGLICSGGVLAAPAESIGIEGSSSASVPRVIHKTHRAQFSYFQGSSPENPCQTFVVGLEDSKALLSGDVAAFVKTDGFKALAQAISAGKATSILFKFSGDQSFLCEVRPAVAHGKDPKSVVVTEVIIYGMQKTVPSFVLEIVKKSTEQGSFSLAAKIAGAAGAVAVGGALGAAGMSASTTEVSAAPAIPARIIPHNSLPLEAEGLGGAAPVPVADPIIAACREKIVRDLEVLNPWFGNPEQDLRRIRLEAELVAIDRQDPTVFTRIRAQHEANLVTEGQRRAAEEEASARRAEGQKMLKKRERREQIKKVVEDMVSPQPDPLDTSYKNQSKIQRKHNLNNMLQTVQEIALINSAESGTTDLDQLRILTAKFMVDSHIANDPIAQIITLRIARTAANGKPNERVLKTEIILKTAKIALELLEEYQKLASGLIHAAAVPTHPAAAFAAPAVPVRVLTAEVLPRAPVRRISPLETGGLGGAGGPGIDADTDTTLLGNLPNDVAVKQARRAHTGAVVSPGEPHGVESAAAALRRAALTPTPTPPPAPAPAPTDAPADPVSVLTTAVKVLTPVSQEDLVARKALIDRCEQNKARRILKVVATTPTLDISAASALTVDPTAAPHGAARSGAGSAEVVVSAGGAAGGSRRGILDLPPIEGLVGLQEIFSYTSYRVFEKACDRQSHLDCGYHAGSNAINIVDAFAVASPELDPLAVIAHAGLRSQRKVLECKAAFIEKSDAAEEGSSYEFLDPVSKYDALPAGHINLFISDVLAGEIVTIDSPERSDDGSKVFFCCPELTTDKSTIDNAKPAMHILRREGRSGVESLRKLMRCNQRLDGRGASICNFDANVAARFSSNDQIHMGEIMLLRQYFSSIKHMARGPNVRTQAIQALRCGKVVVMPWLSYSIVGRTERDLAVRGGIGHWTCECFIPRFNDVGILSFIDVVHIDSLGGLISGDVAQFVEECFAFDERAFVSDRDLLQQLFA